jgi:selenide, water dikinase
MADLAYVLRHLPPPSDPNLLVGRDPADDAAVYRLTDDLALVQTVDFFTPIVDDPYTYGQIAAANSLSDIYAMGGRPLTAMNIVGFPMDTLHADVLGEILRGGADIAREAEVTIVGGHTIDDLEPKYGLAVTGVVDPATMVTAHGARPGDLLVLTKPLGTGTISTALKADAAAKHHVVQAVRWMLTLNRSASAAMVKAGASAATDVTGYGLLGHLADLCAASGVAAEISFDSCPLMPGALEYAGQGFVPKGTRTNLASLESRIHVVQGLDDPASFLLADPQTSGGLLVALKPDRLQRFRAAADPSTLCQVIGRIIEAQTGTIRVIA